VTIQLWRRRRRRLGNFKNFPRLGGGGCIFLGKIGGGGSADRLTPLDVYKSSLEKTHYFIPNWKQDVYK
jgi:hypothetical protein